MKTKLLSIWRKASALAVLGLLFAIGCSKDDSSPDPVAPAVTFADFEFSGIFTGTLSNNGNVSNLEGYVTIAANGSTTLNLLTGRMLGNSVKVGNNYNITVTQATGIFANVSNITGSIDTTSRTIYLSGTNPDGSPVTVGGEAEEVPVMTDGGWSALTKVPVYFTHNESCLANITINGVTLSGLNGFYEPGGLCAPMYALWNSIPHNVEDAVSQMLCHDVTLQALGGGTVTFTDCNTAAFVLAEGTQYTYTIAWENGETQTGTFTTGMDGQGTYICPTTDGPECDGSELEGNSGNPRFNLQFTGDVDMDLYVRTPSGNVINYSNDSADGGTLDVDCTCSGDCNQENIYWQPGTAPSGQYVFWVDHYSSCSGTQSSSYTIQVMNGNTVLQTRTGTLTDGTQSQEYIYTH
jgi:hypothetical protein